MKIRDKTNIKYEKNIDREKDIIKQFLTQEIDMHIEILGLEEKYDLKGFNNIIVKDILEAFKKIEGEL